MGLLDSAQFRGRLTTHVATEQIATSKGCGFVKLTGRVYYMTKLRSLRVVITGVKAPNNRGPNLMLQENTRWAKGGGDIKGMKEHLHALLVKTKNRLRDRDPELLRPRICIKSCNTTGRDDGEFLESVCSGCACWYCELAGA